MNYESVFISRAFPGLKDPEVTLVWTDATVPMENLACQAVR